MMKQFRKKLGSKRRWASGQDNPPKQSKPKPRSCGDCTMCCSVYGIDTPELQKEVRVPCENLCSGGCTIYDTRPPICREFQCLWLQGLFNGSARPDRLGVVFQAVTATGNVKQVVTATECWPMAFDNPKVVELLDSIDAKGVPLVREDYDENRVAKGVLTGKLINIEPRRFGGGAQ